MLLGRDDPLPPRPHQGTAPLPNSWGFVHPELREYCPDLDVSQQEGTGWLRSELSSPEGSQETPVGTWDVAASTYSMKCDRGLGQEVLDEGPSEVFRKHYIPRRMEGDGKRTPEVCDL